MERSEVVDVWDGRVWWVDESGKVEREKEGGGG